MHAFKTFTFFQRFVKKNSLKKYILFEDTFFTFSGMCWRQFMTPTGLEPEAWKYLAVVVPVVTVFGPVGALLSSHCHRQVLAFFIYILDTLALVRHFIPLVNLGPLSCVWVQGSDVQLFSVMFANKKGRPRIFFATKLKEHFNFISPISVFDNITSQAILFHQFVVSVNYVKFLIICKILDVWKQSHLQHVVLLLLYDEKKKTHVIETVKLNLHLQKMCDRPYKRH